MADQTQGKKSILRRIFRIFVRFFAVITAFVIVMAIAVNIPAVQTFIAGKIIQSIREKTGTEISINSLKIALPNTIRISKLYLQDQDADTMLYMHSLNVDIRIFRLLSNEVSINSVELENVVANIKRKKSGTHFNFQFLVDLFSPADTSAIADTVFMPKKPWVFNVKNIRLRNIRAEFFDAIGGIDAKIDLGNFEATAKDFDLITKKLDINEVLLKNTSFQYFRLKPDRNNTLQVASVDSISAKADLNKSLDSTSFFPLWDISANQLTIENTNLVFDNTTIPKSLQGMDYQHLNIRNLNTLFRNIKITKQGYGADIKNISFNESCGLGLRKFTADVQLTSHLAEFKNVHIETTESNISANAKVVFTSVSDFLNEPWKSEMMLQLDSTLVNANEVFLFAPQLAADTLTGKFKNSDVFITASVKGKINDLNIENLEVSLLEKTILKANGKLTGLPDMAKFGFDASIRQLKTNQHDISQFVDPAIFAGLKLPESFELKGSAKGKLNSVKVDLQLNSAYGNVTADAFYQVNDAGRRDTFNLIFSAQNVLAGTIISDTMLGKISLNGKACGSGITKGPLSGSGILHIHEAQYNSYIYTDVTVQGRMSGNLISATASSSDTNLNFELTANADLRETGKKYSVRLGLAKANLHALNLTEKELSLSTTVIAEACYAGLNNSDVNLVLANTTLIGKEKSMPVKSINISAISKADSLKIQLNSDLADGSLSSNISPDNFEKILQTAYRKYFGLPDTNQPQPGKHIAFAMDVHIPQEITNLVVPELEKLRITKLEGSYSSDSNNLHVIVQMPEVVYSSMNLDSLSLVINGNNKVLAMDLSLDRISYDSLQIVNFRIQEQVTDGEILSEIKILDSIGEPEYLLANKIEVGADFFSLMFLPDGLILDGSHWKTGEGNLLEIRKNKLRTENFAFTNDKQSFEFIAGEENRKFIFSNFALQNLVNIVEFEGKGRLIKGNLGGELVLPASSDQKFIDADLTIDKLYILDTLVGNLAVKLKTENDKMTVESLLQNDENKISVSGEVTHLSGTPLLNLSVLLDIRNLYRFEQFSLGYLSDMSGKIDGKLSVIGTTAKPEIIGFLGFEDAIFSVNSLNFLARIKKEKLEFNAKGIHLDNFEIEDKQAEKLTLNGSILTNNYRDFNFDLSLETKNFQVMNSTMADNPLFFGKLSLNTDVKIAGDLQSPKIEAYVKINSSTDLTYAMPGSELQLVSSEGVVQFLDPSKENDSLLSQKQVDYITDSIINRLTGVDLTLNLEIDPGAKFTVDIDPKSGDYLTISGGAKLSIGADATGKQTITGIYVVKSGYYELSFYGLVKKSFTIKPGSTVSWSGRPMDADVNITAENIVRTSSVALVANETASMSDAEKNAFNQRLPYEVLLNIRGFLAQPEISFNIALPDKYLVSYPLIATKLAMLNTEENASELNKQVFALLVTGSFMADNPLSSTGSTPSSIASTAARNSVNGILADQLNKVSGKYISKVDVNFGLTSYEDYEQGSSELRTELDVQVSKKLFNDRLTVEAQGSFDLATDKNKSTTSSNEKMTGEFAVIYALTESGEYKLRVYYENAYDLFDGEIGCSGIALIFEKEFDTLKRQKKQPVENSNKIEIVE